MVWLRSWQTALTAFIFVHPMRVFSLGLQRASFAVVASFSTEPSYTFPPRGCMQTKWYWVTRHHPWAPSDGSAHGTGSISCSGASLQSQGRGSFAIKHILARDWINFMNKEIRCESIYMGTLYFLSYGQEVRGWWFFQQLPWALVGTGFFTIDIGKNDTFFLNTENWQQGN